MWEVITSFDPALLLALIPQFADPTIGLIWMQIIVLGGIFLAFGFAFALCLGALARAFSHAIGSHVGSLPHLLNRLSAVMFTGLAARLVWDR